MSTLPASWTDPRVGIALTGVLAVGALAFVLDLTGEFSPLPFGLGVLGVALVAAAGLLALSR